ncbi:MAG: hypothetical protein J2O48_08505, partial [Solirubrobacterales bacterium]|nr:hypothetical protein [Solirubrobacterales bacterium]
MAHGQGPSLAQLNSALAANQISQRNLAANITALNGEIASLNQQISVVQGRESAVEAQLSADRTQLAETKNSVAAEKLRVKKLKRTLKRDQKVLESQIVANYENPQPNLVSVVLSAHGFNNMLNQVRFLQTAEKAQQHSIKVTQAAKHAAVAAEQRLVKLQGQQTQQTDAAATEANALAGMGQMLAGRQAAVADAQSARRSA